MNQSYKREREDFEMGNLKKKINTHTQYLNTYLKKKKKINLNQNYKKEQNPQEGGREYSQFFFFCLGKLI